MRTFTMKPETKRSAKTSRSHLGRNGEPSSILHAQRTIGNQAVMRLPHVLIDNFNSSSEVNRSMKFLPHFSGISLNDTVGTNIKPKLMVNIPGDIHEQEADRVAEQVVHMPASQTQRSAVSNLEGGALIKAKQAPVGSSEIPFSLATHIQALRGRGQPLSASIRAFFEPRFGHDFHQVRIHTDAPAAQVARALNAHAFTVGRDVVFGAGKYLPKTLKGKYLLGHELTHVIQQKSRVNSSQHIYRADRRRPYPLEGLFEKPPRRTKDSVKTRWQDLDDNDIQVAIRFNSRVYQFSRSIGAIALLAGPGDARVFSKELIVGIAKYQQRNGLRVDGQVGWNSMAHMARRLIGSQANYTEISNAIWLVVDGLNLDVAMVKSIVYRPTQSKAVTMLADCRSIRLGTLALRSYSDFVASLKRGTHMVKKGCKRFNLKSNSPIIAPTKVHKEPKKPQLSEVKPDKEFFIMLALADRNTRAQMGWMALVLDKLTGPNAFDYSFIYRKPSGLKGGCNDDSFGILYFNKVFNDAVNKALKLPKRRMYTWFAAEMCLWGRQIHEAADEISKAKSIWHYRCPTYRKKLSKYFRAKGDSNIYKIWEKALRGASSHCLK